MLPCCFLSNLIPFYGQGYEKEKGPGTMRPLNLENWEMKGEKLQKFQYLESEKSFLDVNFL